MAFQVDVAGTSLHLGLNILFEIIASSFVVEGSLPKLGRGIIVNSREKKDGSQLTQYYVWYRFPVME